MDHSGVMQNTLLVPVPGGKTKVGDKQEHHILQVQGGGIWICGNDALCRVPDNWDGGVNTLNYVALAKGRGSRIPKCAVQVVAENTLSQFMPEVWVGWGGQPGKGYIEIYNGESGCLVCKLVGAGIEVGVSHMLIPDDAGKGAVIWAGLEDGHILLIHAVSRSIVAKWRAHQSPMRALSEVRGGGIVSSISTQGNVRLWDSKEAHKHWSKGPQPPPDEETCDEVEPTTKDLMSLAVVPYVQEVENDGPADEVSEHKDMLGFLSNKMTEMQKTMDFQMSSVAGGLYHAPAAVLGVGVVERVESLEDQAREASRRVEPLEQSLVMLKRTIAMHSQELAALDSQSQTLKGQVTQLSGVVGGVSAETVSELKAGNKLCASEQEAMETELMGLQQEMAAIQTMAQSGPQAMKEDATLRKSAEARATAVRGLIDKSVSDYFGGGHKVPKPGSYLIKWANDPTPVEVDATREAQESVLKIKMEAGELLGRLDATIRQVEKQAGQLLNTGSGDGGDGSGEGINGALSELESSQASCDEVVSSLKEAAEMVTSMEVGHDKDIEDLMAIQDAMSKEEEKLKQGKVGAEGEEERLASMGESMGEVSMMIQEAEKRAETMLATHTEQIARLEGLGDGLGHSATQTEFGKLLEKMGQVQEKLEEFGGVADGLNSLMDNIKADHEGIKERQRAEMDAQEIKNIECIRDSEHFAKMVELRLEPLAEGDNKFRPLLLDLQLKLMESECDNALASGVGGQITKPRPSVSTGGPTSPKRALPGIGKVKSPTGYR